MTKMIIAGVLIIIGIIVLSQTLYKVDETEQVLVTRFGDVKTVHRTAGLRAKVPFVDTVVRFDRRLLRIDADPESMRDSKKENLVIDSYARYRILNPVLFRKTLISEENAFSRLGDIVNSTLREQIALRTRPEIIGARAIVINGIPLEDEEGLAVFESTETRTALLAEVLEGVRLRVIASETTRSEVVPFDMAAGEVFNITLPQMILDRDNRDRDSNLKTGADTADIWVVNGLEGEIEGLDIEVILWSPATLAVTLKVQKGETASKGDSFTLQYFVEREDPLGIEIIDVRIKRADFPDSVTPSIFTRMRAERNRIATKFRAEGDEQDLEIRAEANKSREVILADADKESSLLRGEGEAEAIRILAESLEEDPEFFSFRRSLEAYGHILNTGTTVILSADADLFRFLDSSGVSSGGAP